MRAQVQLIFIMISFLGLQFCSPNIKTNHDIGYTGEVNFISKDEQGTILLKSTGYGNNQKEAVEDAKKNAFNVILFRGIPGTELNIPLIENEIDAKSKCNNYFQKFFNERYYSTFMMSATESSILMRISGLKRIKVDIKINYNSLRKDLEQNQVIRKFGY